MLVSSCSEAQSDNRVLIFTRTAGFRHQSIPAGIEALTTIARRQNIEVDTTENPSNFVEENLKKYKAVIFLSTTGDVLSASQQNAFEKFIRAGGGYLGIHAASDTEYDWPWYGNLVGAYFNGHPPIQQARFITVDNKHQSTMALPQAFDRIDEHYNFKQINPAINVLVTIDEHSYSGGTNGDPHPISWFHVYDGGRAFYTAMGHTEESFKEPIFVDHLTGALRYVTTQQK